MPKTRIINKIIKPQFIISAPSSNGGKTTITLGLLRLLKNYKKQPRPFKCGPDYIDPKFHKLACGSQGINLDLFMMSEEHIINQYSKQSDGYDSVCIEGVMGLFDGALKSKGSTAELASLLKIPVVLVIDAKSTAYSVAPLIHGFKSFDNQIEIAGVIFNRVNTSSHYDILREACEDLEIPSFGYLPFLSGCEIPSRHLGLSLEKLHNYDARIDEIAKALEQNVNIDKLLSACQCPNPLSIPHPVIKKSLGLRIAIAKDEAFNFIYHRTLELFRQIGNVEFFSPMHDQHLPEADFYLFPGGYPELFAKELSSNYSMIREVKNKIPEAVCLAECGGMMYLGNHIKTKDGKVFKMASVFKYETNMVNSKLSLGYRKIRSQNFNFNGHEFHYSSLASNNERTEKLSIKSIRNREITTPVFRRNRCFATYIHVYFESADDILQLFKYDHEDLY